jgi:hypothetical protein
MELEFAKNVKKQSNSKLLETLVVFVLIQFFFFIDMRPIIFRFEMQME